MYLQPIVIAPRKFLAAVGIALLCALLAAYNPMAMITKADSSLTAQFDTLKQQVLTELTKRISDAEQTLASLSVDVHIDNTGAKASVSSTGGTPEGTASISANSSGVSVTLPTGLQDQVKGFTQGIVDELNNIKSQVTNLTSSSSITSALSQLQSIAGNLNIQSVMDQLSQVQSMATQAVQSMTGVLSNLQSAANGLQTQVTALSSCVSGIADGSQSLDTTVSESDGVKVTCGSFNVSSNDIVSGAQSQLSNIMTVVSTVSSVLLSAVTLLVSLVSEFSGVFSSIGGSSGLGDLSSLTSLTSSLGSVSGIMSAFTSIVSELDTSNSMSSGASGLLSSLTSLINI